MRAILIYWVMRPKYMSSSTERIKEKAREYFNNARGSHDWDHTRRVYNLCLRIGKTEKKADMEILKIAALLHDIGRGKQDDSFGDVCHAKKGAQMARKLLDGLGLDREKTRKIIHCIEVHRLRGNSVPKTIEAKVLFDADKLDSIGAVGIGRDFLFAGEIGARLYNKGVDIEKTKAYTKEDTAYREYYLKLRKVKERMLTKEGKRLAAGRHRYMVDFFDRMDKEVRGVI